MKIVLETMETTSTPLNLEFIQLTTAGEMTQIHLNDVIFGDVYVCSGQSNMDWALILSLNGYEETLSTSNYSNIRLLKIAPKESDVPLNDIDSVYVPWSLPTGMV